MEFAFDAFEGNSQSNALLADNEIEQ